MRIEELRFDRPEYLQAREPPEARGLSRDAVRLMVSRGEEVQDRQFAELPDLLASGDLLVVNRSATLPASLRATYRGGTLRWNLSTVYGNDVYVAELRYSTCRPGPIPLAEGESLEVSGIPVRHLGPYPGLPRLSFYRAPPQIMERLVASGEPIRYGYADQTWPLDYYQTLFSTVPGSAEMPSAARPFTPRVLAKLQARGVGVADIVLHCGVSSLEVENTKVEEATLYPEPFLVSPDTARAVNRARAQGRRVIAVGTTVVRALEAAWDGCQVRAQRGFTRRYVSPQRPAQVVNGLLTGFHDPLTTHLALLRSFVDGPTLHDLYLHAVRERYLWHEFGDVHLLLPPSS